MTSGSIAPLGPRARDRRTRELNERIGRQIAELRQEASVSQSQLAGCAGLTQGYLWQVEAGRAKPSISALVAIGHCLGADLGMRYFPGFGPRIHDRFQAPMIEALIRTLGPDWSAHPEVAVPAARGVLDIVLRRASDGLVVACECHSELRRLEIVIRRLGEKADALAGQLDASPTVSRLLLLRSTAATRATARAYEATLTAAFPGRTAAAVASLRRGGEWPGPTIVWARLQAGRAEILEGPPRRLTVGR